MMLEILQFVAATIGYVGGAAIIVAIVAMGVR
jgi:hypothetical protein